MWHGSCIWILKMMVGPRTMNKEEAGTNCTAPHMHSVAPFMAVSRSALRFCCSCNLIFSMHTLQPKKQNCACSLKCSFILKFTEIHPSLSFTALGSKLSLLDNVALSVVGTLEIYRKESLFHENQWQKLPGFCSVV